MEIEKKKKNTGVSFLVTSFQPPEKGKIPFRLGQEPRGVRSWDYVGCDVTTISFANVYNFEPKLESCLIALILVYFAYCLRFFLFGSKNGLDCPSLGDGPDNSSLYSSVQDTTVQIDEFTGPKNISKNFTLANAIQHIIFLFQLTKYRSQGTAGAIRKGFGQRGAVLTWYKFQVLRESKQAIRFNRSQMSKVVYKASCWDC